jgi:hypothetical protein
MNWSIVVKRKEAQPYRCTLEPIKIKPQQTANSSYQQSAVVLTGYIQLTDQFRSSREL